MRAIRDIMAKFKLPHPPGTTVSVDDENAGASHSVAHALSYSCYKRRHSRSISVTILFPHRQLSLSGQQRHI